jgi:lysophospholipase L1-like esterase
MPDKHLPDAAKCRRFRDIVTQAIADGMMGLHYIDGHDLFGSDGEASIDGIHPGDLGYMRMADALEPVLRRL